MVCPDVEDVFLPLARGFLVEPMQSKSVRKPLIILHDLAYHCVLRTQILGLLDLLPRLYQETQYGEVALGAAVKGALAGLVSLGRLYDEGPF